LKSSQKDLNNPFQNKKYSKMAKKGNRIQVILECTEHKTSGVAGTKIHTTKNKKIHQID
jgi:hypothetical protein